MFVPGLHISGAAVLAGLCAILLSITPGPGISQEPPSLPGAGGEEGVEVLARGPVHEAFASTAEFPVNGSPVIAKVPPDAIEELPPEQKPEGENVQWLPGYWSWDEDRNDYLWVSGFWRNAPPNRVWVAGNWQEVRGGFQWVQGFWKLVRPVEVAQPNVVPVEEIRYLPPPPVTVESGPTIPAPDETSVYVPGCWVWQNRYVWRPGVWIAHRPGWIWTPARYCWSPAGYVFVDGYWDYPLDSRGILFAPVYFSRPVYARPAYVYAPTIVVSEPCLYGSLFVRRGWGSYYFGDYFDRRHVGLGYTPWTGLNVNFAAGGVNVNVNIGGRGGYAYDPLWSYYRTAHRHNPAWAGGVNELYAGRYQGTIVRPPHTLVQQRTVINNIANNSISVVNRNEVRNNIVTNNVVNNITNVTMLTPITNVQRSVVNAPQAKGGNVIHTEAVKLQAVSREARVQEQAAVKQIRQLAVERKNSERQIVSQGGPPKTATDAPKTAPISMPQPLMARARPRDAANTPPPNPLLSNSGASPKGETKIDPKTGAPSPAPRAETLTPPRSDAPPAKGLPKMPPDTNAGPKTPGSPPKTGSPFDPNAGPKAGLPTDPKLPPMGTPPAPKGVSPTDPKLPPLGTPTTPKGVSPTDPKLPPMGTPPAPKGVSPTDPKFPPKGTPPTPKVENKLPPVPQGNIPPRGAPPMGVPPQPAPPPRTTLPPGSPPPPARSNLPTQPPVETRNPGPPANQPPQSQPRTMPPVAQPPQPPRTTPPVAQPPQPPRGQPPAPGPQAPPPNPGKGPPAPKKPPGNPGQGNPPAPPMPK